MSDAYSRIVRSELFSMKAFSIFDPSMVPRVIAPFICKVDRNDCQRDSACSSMMRILIAPSPTAGRFRIVLKASSISFSLAL